MKGFCVERAGIAVVSKLLIVLLSFGTVGGHAESAPTALRCGTPYVLQAMDAASELSTEHQRLKLVPWDGRNAAGKFVASGVYHLFLEADGQTALHRLAVVRD